MHEKLIFQIHFTKSPKRDNIYKLYLWIKEEGIFNNNDVVLRLIYTAHVLIIKCPDIEQNHLSITMLIFDYMCQIYNNIQI